ncbi:MAG: Gfo/Idh/MocA family oxidoreductase [Bacteroidia bacterium]
MLHTRRSFLQTSSRGLGGLVFVGAALSMAAEPAACQTDRPLGIALVGLGNYSKGQLAPALQQTTRCRLAGIVTGTPAKAEEWSQKYSIPAKNIYNYETFDAIADNPDIDIVYVVLPNAMHAEYTIRAARAGKHVICEKPMAVSAQECKDMIRACQEAGVKLSIGYRLHYDPFHREVMRIGQEQVLGKIKLIENSFGFRSIDWANWRFEHALAGGGALMDVGVYCVNAACYMTGEQPVAITAQEIKTYPQRFKDVDETLLWQMEFPGGAMASCTTSYAIGVNRLLAHAEEGSFELQPSYGYGGIGGHIKGEALSFKAINQQAAQMDAFAQHILEGTPNLVPGEMGLRDMQIIEAIYRAVASRSREMVVYG